MATEIILLVNDTEHVREAVAESLARAGSFVEAVPDCERAVEFLLVFRPDWILVGERQAAELLDWVGRQERLRTVPVVLCPDLDLPLRLEDDGAERTPHAA
jgi:chemotaxis response regulator CheB